MARDDRSNNFDLLRLVAAAAVVVSHSFALTAHSEPTIASQTLGTQAVVVFFGISGFLITRSWDRAPRLGGYLRKRLLRILPAYAAMLVICAFVIGPLVTTDSLHKYFSNPGASKYVLDNLLLWHTVYVLPGVFAHNAYPLAVNGSIWTITYELRAYLLVALMGLLGVFRWRATAVLYWVVVLMTTVTTFPTFSASSILGEPNILAAFAAGSVLYRFRDQVPLRLELAALGTVAWLILPLASAGYWVGAVIVPYTAVTLAFHTPASWRRLTRRGDFSYGLYLWAFPVQQIFGQIRGITTAEMIVVALPVSYLLGGASWLLLERHAMRFRSGRTRRPMITAPAPASGAATEAG